MANKPENLKPFKKGFDPRRHLTGKPVGTVSITKLVREGLKKIGKGESEPYEELLTKKILTKAIRDGNEKIIQLVWAYMDGAPKNTDFSDTVKSVAGLLLGMTKHETPIDEIESDDGGADSAEREIQKLERKPG